MKILHVCNFFHPANIIGGGVSKVAYDQVRRLSKRGHDVTVFTTDAYLNGSHLPKNEPVKIDNFEVYYFDTVRIPIGKMTVNKPIARVYIKQLINNYDVIHLHGSRSPFLHVDVAHYAMKISIPYVIQTHGALPTAIGNTLGKKLYDIFFGDKILKNATKILALNKLEARQQRKRGIPPEKIAVIPNGIDLSEYADLRSKGCFKEKFNIPEDKKIILYLGRIHKTKGIDFLVRAYAYLIKKMKYNDAILVIAGPDDGYFDEAKSLSDSLSISDLVLFTGFISSEDKLEVLVDADVFVTPSFYGFPMTFLEACATGTPIITTTLGDTLEWINGNTGYVTSPTYYDLAKAIYTIISGDGLRRKFSRDCRETVSSKFSLEKVVERLEEVYKDVADPVKN